MSVYADQNHAPSLTDVRPERRKIMNYGMRCHDICPKTDIDTKPKTPTTDAKTDSKTDIDTKPKTPTTDAKDKAPETGDSSCMALYLVLMVIAAMSGALVCKKKK